MSRIRETLLQLPGDQSWTPQTLTEGSGFIKTSPPMPDIRAAAPGPDGTPSRYECKKCKAPIEAGVATCRAKTEDEDGLEHECGGKRRYIGLLMHDMRRSAARRLRNNGTHENVIMAIGGWKTRSMFDRYAIVNNYDKRRALEALQDQSAHNSRRTAPDS